MNVDIFNKALFSLLKDCPTPYHATNYIQKKLSDEGSIALDEGESWRIETGKKYHVARNGSLIAFSLGAKTTLDNGFRMIGAHTDSPSLQIKPHIRTNSAPYIMAGVEKYGGALLSTWFDRELSLAGLVTCSSRDSQVAQVLIDFKKPLLYIPSLAIHLNRKANEGMEMNVQEHFSPILGQVEGQDFPDFIEILKSQINKDHPDVSIDGILGFDLFCYDLNKPVAFGFKNDFLAAPRLDNLLSCHVGLEAICHAGEDTNALLLFTNHEEVGSTSSSGAIGNFIDLFMARILKDPEQRAICLHNSFLLSLDNAHATHPNYKDKSDGDHLVLLNKGPVIKINASQRYASSALTASIFRLIASEVGVDTQDFVMRSDMACGSTIGPLTAAKLGIDTVDVGAPTWGMHSIREVTGVSDPLSLYTVSRHFLNRSTLPVPI
jgi:aspartyl aminopeptidase